MSDGIRVSVRLFGAFLATVGEGTLERQLASGSSVDALWHELVSAWPQLGALEPVRLNAVNHDFVAGERVLREGDEVAFFPPVSGG